MCFCTTKFSLTYFMCEMFLDLVNKEFSTICQNVNNISNLRGKETYFQQRGFIRTNEAMQQYVLYINLAIKRFLFSACVILKIELITNNLSSGSCNIIKKL